MNDTSTKYETFFEVLSDWQGKLNVFNEDFSEFYATSAGIKKEFWNMK